MGTESFVFENFLLDCITARHDPFRALLVCEIYDYTKSELHPGSIGVL